MKLSSEEIERYARQIVLRGVGGPGQNKLKAARVMAIGAGGLGSPLLQYLAGAGVGEIAIVDDDVGVAVQPPAPGVAWNRRRRAPEGRQRAGGDRPAQPACARRKDRPAPRRGQRPRRWSPAMTSIVDGSDNFATRYAVSDACFYERRPLVSAAIGEFDGALTTLKPYERNARGRAESDLSVPLSRSAAAGNRSRLRGSRRAGRGRPAFSDR